MRYKLGVEFLWVLFGQGMAFIGGILVIKVFTNSLGAEKYGYLGLGLSIAALVSTFFYGPLGQVLVRFFVEAQDKNCLADLFGYQNLLIRRFIVLVLMLSLVIVTILVMNSYYMMALILVSALLYGLSRGSLSLLTMLGNAQRQRKLVALSQLLDPWLRLAIGFFLFLFVGSVEVVLIGFALATLMIAYFVRMKLKSENSVLARTLYSNKPSKGGLKDNYWQYCKPFAAFAGFAAICNYSDRWILGIITDVRDVGGYIAMYQLATAPIVVLSSVINQMFVPILFNGKGDKKNLLWSVWCISFLSLLVLCVIYYIFDDSIVMLLTGREYLPYKNLLVYLAVGFSVFQFSQFLFLKVQLNKEVGRMLPAWLVRTFVILTLGPWATYYMGVNGMAGALLVSSLIFLAVVYIYVINGVGHEKEVL